MFPIGKLTLALMTLVIHLEVFSQVEDWTLYKSGSEKIDTTRKDSLQLGVTYSMENDLQEYLSMMDSISKEENESAGYRIQIYSGSGADSRKTAYEKQTEFLSLYPNVSSYTLWKYPNWVVRVGDFRTRLEALEYHTELRNEFPASFMIKDQIKSEFKKEE